MSHSVALDKASIADQFKLDLKKIPEETLLSFPVLTLRDEGLYQGIFLYQNDRDDTGMITRPFAWSLEPVKTAYGQFFSWCKLMDFVDTSNYPLKGRVLASLPLVGENLTTLEKELDSLFQELVGFAFKKAPTKKQTVVIDRYKELFLQLVPTGLFPFYIGLAPDFFQWLELNLISPKAALTLKPAAQSGSELVQLLLQLSNQFEEKIQTDQQKEALYTQMHGQLHEYKAGILERITYSVERDVILVIDNIEKTKRRMTNEPPTPAGYQRMLHLFETIKQDLVDLLYRQGVDPYVVEGDTVQLPRQKVLSTVTTHHPEQDKKIAEKLTQGWEKGSQVVRPEYVTVYLYDKESKDKGAVNG